MNPSNLSFGLSSSKSEKFTTQILGCSGEVIPHPADKVLFDDAKAPGLNDCKSDNIKNIARLAIVQPRELSLSSNRTLSAGWGINGQRPFTSRKSTRDASKLPEFEGEKPKTQVSSCDYLIFDVGNVLLKWDPLRLAQVLKEEDPSFPIELFWIYKSHEWAEFDRGELCHETVVQKLNHRFPEIYLSRFIQRAAHFLKPMEETVTLLKKCKERGYPLYILSNMPAFYRDYLLKTFDFFHLFDGAIFSCDVKVNKPDPRIYLHLLKTFDLSATRALFIDDRKENIVQGEKMLIKGIHFQSASQCRQELEHLHVL